MPRAPPSSPAGGFADRSRSSREEQLRCPCRFLGAGRLSRAALGFLPKRESPPATESGVARPASVPLRSFLPPWIFRSVLRGGSVVSRSSPPGGAAPQPGHQPPRSGGAAKGGTKDKTAEGQPLRRPSDPVARV